MNTKGEKIVIKPIIDQCREMNVQELFSLLKSDIAKFWSWGVLPKSFKAEGEYTKYFRMIVQGHHHKGHVWIFLNGLDLFDVYFTSRQNTIKEIKTDLYFDMLVDVIDKFVEWVPEYKN